MNIVIIGAGRVATHLSVALQLAGACVVQVFSRTLVSAANLAEKLCVPYTDNIKNVVCDADMYLVAVSDDALSDVAKTLVPGREKALFVHTAGSVPMSIWHEAGADHYGILYPLQTFSKDKKVELSLVSFFVEASDEKSLQRIESVAHRLTSHVYRADSERRSALHVAAVFACNFSNAMYCMAEELLKKADLPFEGLLPLIDETAAKVHVLNPVDAQTGPAVRGDDEVMAQHRKMLADHAEWQRLYERISKVIQEYHDKL